MSEDQKRLTAYHEGGHAIVGRLMPSHDPVYKVSIIPRGRGARGDDVSARAGPLQASKELILIDCDHGFRRIVIADSAHCDHGLR